MPRGACSACMTRFLIRLQSSCRHLHLSLGIPLAWRILGQKRDGNTGQVSHCDMEWRMRCEPAKEVYLLCKVCGRPDNSQNHTPHRPRRESQWGKQWYCQIYLVTMHYLSSTAQELFSIPWWVKSYRFEKLLTIIFKKPEISFYYTPGNNFLGNQPSFYTLYLVETFCAIV